MLELVAAPAPGRIAGFSPFELPSTFGHYRVEREIAAGGMGMVYEAEDTRLSRRVALKMLRQVLFSTAEARQRFQNEAELASQLDHPNIVPILEIGKSEGQPYLTMKLIRGGNLADRLASGALPVREAAGLMVLIARAVHHAHQHGVLHRDLKPANILLDEMGSPWLTDFGLAKLLEDNAGNGNTQTQTIAGTPDYMSPEQAAGRRKEISTASDVWALGVILYQMLTGRLPFRGESPSEILRKVADGEPPKPSTIEGHTDQDLETLCLRCLDKSPAHRLASACELADELERWLKGEPIHARRITAIERFGKWVRRHPYRATTLTALLLLVLGAAAAITWQWQRAEANAERERRTAYSATLAQALAVRENHDFGQARRLLDGIDPELRGFDWRLLKALCHGDEKLAHRLGAGPGAVPQCFTLTPDGEHLAIVSADGRLHLRDLRGVEVTAPRALPTTSNQASDACYGLVFSPDGQRLAYGQGDVLRVLDTRTLTLLHEEISCRPQFGWLDDHRLLYGFNGSVTAPPYPAPGAWILDFRDVHASSDDVPIIAFPNMCAPLAVSPDRRVFVLHRVEAVPASWARTLHVYETNGDLAKIPEPLYSLPGREYPGDLTLSYSGRYLALSAGAELSRAARVLDVTTGEVLFENEFRFPIQSLAIDRAGRRLGLVGDDSSVRVYDFTRGTPSGENANTYDDDVALVRSQPVSGRGANAPPRDLISRSAQDGRAVFYLGHEKAVLDVAFDGNGSLVTCSGDGTIRYWPVGVPHPTVRLGHIEGTYRTLHPVASHDGLQVLYSTHFQFVRLCDVALSRISEHDRTWPVSDRHTPLAMLQDGRAITQDKVTTEVVIWKMQDGEMVEQQRLSAHCPNSMHNGGTRSGALSQDEKHLAGVMNRWLFSVDLERGTMVWSGSPEKASSSFAGHAISPDGKWIASSDFGPEVTIHPFAAPEKIVATLSGGPHAYDTAVAFSRDGRHLYVGNEDGSIHVWDTATWREIPESSWQAHLSAVTAIAVSNDSTLIATSGDSILKLFPIEPEPGQSQRRERLSFQLDQAANWIQFARAENGTDRALLHSVPGGTIEIWETDVDHTNAIAEPAEPGNLPFPRSSHAAIRLADGKVLVAGGESIEPVALSACHLYDPDKGTWQSTGPMRRPRSQLMLTMLPGGKVLVAGGKGLDYVPLADCELYDPETGIWTPTDTMMEPRFGGTSILLQNGKVLVLGGNNAIGPVNRCELYHPDSGTWTPAGALISLDRLMSSVLLADGSVIVINGGQGIQRVERYDPASGRWNAVSSTLPDRHGTSATLLASGEVLVAGGVRHSTCHLYDPLSGKWQVTSSFPRSRDRHTTTLLPDGKVLVAGGFEPPSTVNSCLLYDPATGTWDSATDIKVARQQHTATLLENGKVLLVGGRDEKGSPTKSVEVYDAEESER